MCLNHGYMRMTQQTDLAHNLQAILRSLDKPRHTFLAGSSPTSLRMASTAAAMVTLGGLLLLYMDSGECGERGSGLAAGGKLMPAAGGCDGSMLASGIFGTDVPNMQRNSWRQ